MNPTLSPAENAALDAFDHKALDLLRLGLLAYAATHRQPGLHVEERDRINTLLLALEDKLEGTL